MKKGRRGREGRILHQDSKRKGGAYLLGFPP